MSAKESSFVVESEDGSLISQDVAKAEAVRNQSESSTSAGSWRFVERLMNARAAELDARERCIAERESGAASAVREAEIAARAAGAKLLEEASIRAAAIIRTALEDAGQLGQKAAVDAGAIRQAAQDHLVAGIALADAARLPPMAPPSGAQMLVKLGETFINRAGGMFEKLMVTNPEAGSRLAQRISDAMENTESDGAAATPAPVPPTLGDLARAADALGGQAVGEFLAARGLQSIDELSVNEAAALVKHAAEVAGAGHERR